MITHLETNILECEVKWALGRITTNRAKLVEVNKAEQNKASGSDGIPVELFQILEDGAVKVLCSRMVKLSHNCIHLTC